jgi:hypothetical protein
MKHRFSLFVLMIAGTLLFFVGMKHESGKDYPDRKLI